ncbi:MAG: hypothetical protein WCQ47_08550, partial [bacterium]
KTKLINLIKEQIQKGENGRIVIKANILTNPEIINVLKEAKQAGVKVDLIIRERSLANEELGVRSILGSFLEHMRIYQFGDGNDSKIYISSGDPSTEKLTMRYETFLEIDSPNVKNDLMDILNANLKDNRGAWIQGDDEYTKVEPDKSELSFGVQRYLRNKAGSKRYEGPEGLRTLLVDCAKNKWNLSTAYKNYPELFSKQNVEDFINLAGQQTTRSAGIDMLNKANFLIGQLAKNDQELESLKPLIGAVSANLVNTDVDILRARLEQYLGKKLDNIGDKQLVSDAAEMIISLNCNLNNSDLLTKILFGSIEDDYKDGVISLLSVMHANKNKINGLILLSIASNEKINLDGTMLEMSNYLGNIVDKNPIIRVAVDDIDAAGFDMIKGIDIKSGEMEKVFSVISKISEGASVLK